MDHCKMKEIIHIYILYVQLYSGKLYELYSGNYINITLCIIMDHCKMKENIHIFILYVKLYS